ncbi:transketolase [Sulfoacidibacillus thermotolerans]|uniref:Transketolase n=1 Tax=Sulfoacidibacillus thermotolerans TaxID=1765684 RepID=A0A2U3D9D1_SULT2|nr:transketolase [Sulfoacidibacillus thermotolerans]
MSGGSLLRFDRIDLQAITTIRTLCIDAIEKANSGHPGLPMGAAPMAYVLWTKIMRITSEEPSWVNRDRFVLSAGHGSMLLYSLLHLSGYDLTLEDLKNFRQFNSKTPGHPEYGHVPGVETTTGPLGQGLANAVGMAMAERFLAARYNRKDFEIIHHNTYAIVGDGDLMEGVTAEAASLAGHLKLGKLNVLYDSNDISLDGETKMSFTEDVSARFRAYGWQVLRVEDGNDLVAIAEAVEQARGNEEQPTLIEVRTQIGFGSPNKVGTSSAHGSPLGKEEVALTKKAYGWDAEQFHVPQPVRQRFSDVQARNRHAWQEWEQQFIRYSAAYPEIASEFKQMLAGEITQEWMSDLPFYKAPEEYSTRQASGNAIQLIAKHIPYLIGGSADLASSNETTIKGASPFQAGHYEGRNIWFGVREHAMGAILNGMALHSGLRVFGGTFLVFSDYLRPAMRMAALMKLPVVYVLTHDSIGVGEDGPTHQPVEHVASLRAMPNMVVIRPADANETSAAWRYALLVKDAPVSLILTRQKLSVLPDTHTLARNGVIRGAYVLADSPLELGLRVVLLATGSEVSLVYEAHLALAKEGIGTRVVSMPSWELFEQQPVAYRESVLPPALKARVAVEMGVSMGWERYVGDHGVVIGLNRFGASGPASQLLPEFGFSVEHVIQTVREILKATMY